VRLTTFDYLKKARKDSPGLHRLHQEESQPRIKKMMFDGEAIKELITSSLGNRGNQQYAGKGGNALISQTEIYANGENVQLESLSLH